MIDAHLADALEHIDAITDEQAELLRALIAEINEAQYTNREPDLNKVTRAT